MTLLRSVILGAVAVAIARCLQALLADPCVRSRRIAWGLLLAPYFTPVLLTGYAYGNFSLSLIHHPNVNALLYAMLLGWKFTPLAAVMLHFTPAPISAEAIHCRRLSFLSTHENTSTTRWPASLAGRLDHWRFLVRVGCARGPIAAFAVVFLGAFAEFEMASLMGVKSWTVTLFDANAGGMSSGESLRRMLGPFLCQAAALATAVFILGKQQVTPARVVAASGRTHWFAWCHLAVAFVFVLLIPAAMVSWGTLRGFGLLLENFVLGREIISSLLFATAATLLASVAVGWLSRAAMVSILGRATLLTAVCLGLLGPLMLSLIVLAVGQMPGLLSLRDTPVPLVLTLGLVLLPLALVLKRVLELTGCRSGLHLALLLPGSRSAGELKWRLNTGGRFWAVVLLFVGAYWDLTASAILAPIGMTPATVRLYNLMHYGQIATLSALTCATFAAPVLIFWLAWGTRRWWAPQ